MTCCALMFVLVCIGCANGRPRLPPLPVKDGCYQVTPEVEVFRVEGEAVVLHFPIFSRALEVRGIAPPPAGYLIRQEERMDVMTSHDAETLQDVGTPQDMGTLQDVATLQDMGTPQQSGTPHSGGRVQQHSKQLWLLPARSSDSGEYTCTYRNETFCISGSITLHVLESLSVGMELLSYPVSAAQGEELRLSCPSLSVFNRTDENVQWFKDSSSIALSTTVEEDRLMIAAVTKSHAGVYTCRLRVSINQQQFTISRVILLHVQGTDPEITAITPTDPSVTSDTGLPSSTTHSPVMQPPQIISPLNGSVYESSHGSGLEMFCLVLTDCRLAGSTQVTWLVNGQSVETSYLDRRALQGGRRVTGSSDSCQVELRLLVFLITEEDEKTEVKCVAQNDAGRQEVVARLQLEDSTFTWIIVAAVAASCFLAVVSVFLYILFKPQRKKNMDYFLARQNSTF